MKRRALIATALVLGLAIPASAKFEAAGDDDVRFLAKGPAGMKINGKASGFEANERGGKLVIKVPVNDMKTGIGLRDRHLKKYLKAGQHPKAELVVDRGKLKLPDDKKVASGEATGQFTLAGVTKPLKFNYKAKRTGSDYHVQARATVDIRDHDIEVPCYLGVCVDPEVKIKVKFKLRDK
ncbi:MAG: YceI family protein [Polyangiaceae bacterium]